MLCRIFVLNEREQTISGIDSNLSGSSVFACITLIT